jgi:Putative glycolipid-binding
MPHLDAPGGPGESTALHVRFPDLTCVRSRQRYDRLGPSTFKSVALGAYAGFEAQLIVGGESIVRRYKGLFDLIEPKP